VGKNVAVFVDVANIFYAAKAAGVDIDYVTLLKSASAGRDLVRAYAYTGLDPDNENQRNFHDFLRRSNYKVVSKDIRKYGDGKVKANLDIELVVDMMKTARNLDIAIVVSGDGDFAPAIRAVQEQGVRVEVISFRGNTSSDLIEVADQFTDIVQLARVEKGSRSGRRVAEDGADLSMTEVPDKLTEGTGMGRGGRGRGRGRIRDEEPAAASRGRGPARTGVPAPVGVAAAASGAGLVALPGERLARAGGGLTEADMAAAEVFTLDEAPADGASAGGDAGPADGRIDDDEPRRRRRRGGRGRGRGRGRPDEVQDAEEAPEAQPVAAARAVRPAPMPPRDLVAADVDGDADEDEEVVAVPRAPRTTPFGSVWDSQLGTPAARSAAPLTPINDDEDFDEPEIPEYLIAEQRRGANRGGGGGGNRGARGGRSAYQSAMERERFGRGGSSGGVASGGGRGINRYPDVSARPRPAGPAREDRSYSRPERDAVPPRARSSSEPWSDVPPELEALLRAQVAQKPAPVTRARPAEDLGSGTERGGSEAGAVETAASAAPKARAARKPSTRAPRATAATGTDVATASAVPELTDVSAGEAPKRRTTRSPKAASAGTAEASPAAVGAEPAKAAAKPRAVRKPSAPRTAAGAAEVQLPEAEAATPAPKRRATRKAATPETA
jgi:uncharacterized LabA/DUF88 family protein